MFNASAQKLLGFAQPKDFVAKTVHQFRLRVRPAIGQLTLELIPDSFIRVQFRRVGREPDQMQPPGTSQELLHRVSSMNPSIVEQSDNVAADVSQQVPEESRHFRPLDVILVKMTVERAMKAARADGDG